MSTDFDWERFEEDCEEYGYFTESERENYLQYLETQGELLAESALENEIEEE